MIAPAFFNVLMVMLRVLKTSVVKRFRPMLRQDAV